MIRTELDRLVSGIWRSGRCADQALRYNRPLEQIFFHYPDGHAFYSPLIFVGTKQCSDGSEYDEFRPASRPVIGFDAVIHTHQNRRRERPHDPTPGTRDGVVPRQQNVPNYGLSSVGVWVVRPGPSLSVELVDGSWGIAFDPAGFAAALNRGGGDVAVGNRVICR